MGCHMCFHGVGQESFQFRCQGSVWDRRSRGTCRPLRKAEVQQERAAVFQLLYHVIFVQVHRVVAGYEVGLVYQVGAADGTFPEAQVGDGQAPGFFGVVFKIPLGSHVRVVADDLDGVLGGADRAVPAQTPELAGDDVPAGGVMDGGDIQGQMGHIVRDAYGKKGLGAVFEDRRHLGRSGVLGA